MTDDLDFIPLTHAQYRDKIKEVLTGIGFREDPNTGIHQKIENGIMLQVKTYGNFLSFSYKREDATYGEWNTIEFMFKEFLRKRPWERDLKDERSKES
jgi:hypothetical protein